MLRRSFSSGGPVLTPIAVPIANVTSSISRRRTFADVCAPVRAHSKVTQIQAVVQGKPFSCGVCPCRFGLPFE
jgi:hypothetical protein